MSKNKYNVNRVRSGHINEWMLSELAKDYQAKHGLLADGLIGPVTIQSLLNQREDSMEVVPSNAILAASLKIAQSDIGKGEEGGNNSGPYVEMILGKKYDGNPDDDGAWCAAFVSHCLKKGAEAAGVKLPVKTSFGAKQLFSNMSEKDMTPQVGDVVCWDRGPLNEDGSKSWMGHVGIVERVEGNIFHTIEGNKGSYPSVVRRFQYDIRHESRLEGFGRIAQKKARPKKAKPQEDSESATNSNGEC